MLSKRKKIFILTGMFVLLAATAVINYVIAQADEPGAVEPTGSVFSMYRAERLSKRSEDILYLQSIVATEGEELAEARITAVADIDKINNRTELEFEIEQILKAKGYDDVVVLLGSLSENINVIYTSEAAEVLPQDAAIIYTALYEIAEVPPEMVFLLPLYSA